ncbi:MAG TPA: lysophospholipid acyltransferase family protein [Tepidisphaeraceae bacterium]|jgi:1-acyl-sn-glycerol-3-phosphate acyltransferase
MSDAFYRAVRLIGQSAFAVSSRPLVIGIEHTRRSGAYLLAANHQSPYDVALLIRHVGRRIDFVSSVEVFAHPLVAWFYGSMNAFPLDRRRPDSAAVRRILDRLARGRCVGIFPEGGFRRGEASVVYSLNIRPGVGRIAHLAGAPIVPAVLIGSNDYARPAAWLPIRRTRYGLIFGAPIPPSADAAATDRLLAQTLANLHAELAAKLGRAIPRAE